MTSSAVFSCALAAGALLAAAPADASCVPATPAEQLRRADAVFRGQVVSVGSSGASARFRVLSVRKGAIKRGGVVRVVANPYPSSVTIGWQPRVGQRWRVYVDRRGGRWLTNDCRGTRRA